MVRRTVGNEAYYTSSSLAASCVETVNCLFPLQDFHLIVEPSAGEGVFYDLLPTATRVGIDVEPHREDYVHTDFLTWKPLPFPETVKEGKILTLGNPPFGVRGSLAVRFIQHAASFSDVVAFILPMSFNKDTFQNRVPLLFHLQYSENCTSEYEHAGKLVNVKTVFQIWEKRTNPRLIVPRLQTHEDFTLKHAHLSRITREEHDKLCREYDFAIPQVGSNFTPRQPRDLTQGSHWFVKANTVHVEKIFHTLDFSFLEGQNTAHMSLSRKDIVEAYVAASTRLSSVDG